MIIASSAILYSFDFMDFIDNAFKNSKGLTKQQFEEILRCFIINRNDQCKKHFDGDLFMEIKKYANKCVLVYLVICIGALCYIIPNLILNALRTTDSCRKALLLIIKIIEGFLYAAIFIISGLFLALLIIVYKYVTKAVIYPNYLAASASVKFYL